MNVAKYLLLALLMLPVAELAAFIAVAVQIGFPAALALLLAGSFAGALVLRRAGGNHIERMRVALAQGGFTAVRADSVGSLTLLGGILLLIPGFITDAAGLVVLVVPIYRRLMGGARPPAPAPPGVVDLEPDHWRRVPDAALNRPHGNDTERNEGTR